jgi:hypothetical protein
LQAAAANGVYKSVSRLSFAVRDFRGSQLMLSDIQFYLQIPAAASPAEATSETAATKTLLYPSFEMKFDILMPKNFSS